MRKLKIKNYEGANVHHPPLAAAAAAAVAVTTTGVAILNFFWRFGYPQKLKWLPLYEF